MNNIKKKIFLYAFAVPALLAIFGCENKCAPGPEETNQSADAKVAEIWGELLKQKPDMSVVANLIQKNITTTELADKLVKEESEKGVDGFFCIYLGQKLDEKTAKALGLIIDLLSRKTASASLERMCTMPGGKLKKPLEKLTADDRSSTISGEDVKALDEAIAKIVEKSPDDVVKLVLSHSSTEMDRVVKACNANNESKAVTLGKLQRNVPSSKEKEFNKVAAANGVDVLKLNVGLQEVMDVVNNGATADTKALKGLFDQVLRADAANIDSLMKNRGFLGKLVLLPANADTQAIWASVKSEVAEADFATNISNGGMASTFNKLVNRPAGVTDDSSSLKAITQMVVRIVPTAPPASAQNWFRMVDDDQNQVNNFLNAVIGDRTLFDRVYREIDFSAPARRTLVETNLISHADDPIVRQIVRVNIGVPNKIKMNRLAAEANKLTADRILAGQQIRGLYRLLVDGEDAKLTNLKAIHGGGANFSVKISEIKAEDSLDIYQDLIARELSIAEAAVPGSGDAAVLANVVNKRIAGNPTVFGYLIDDALRPAAPDAEDAEARLKLIALLLEKGDNTTGALANNQTKVNLVLNAIAQYGTDDAAKTASFAKVHSLADNLPRIARWAADPAASNSAVALLTAVGAPLEAGVQVTDLVLANAAAAAHAALGVPADLANRLAELKGLVKFRNLLGMTQAEKSALAQQAPTAAAAGRRTFLQAIVGLPLAEDNANQLIEFLVGIQDGNPANLDFLNGGYPPGAAGESIFRSLFALAPLAGDNANARNRVIAKVVELITPAAVIASVDDGTADTKARVASMLDAVWAQGLPSAPGNIIKLYNGFDYTRPISRDAFALWAGHNAANKLSVGDPATSVAAYVNTTNFATSANFRDYIGQLKAEIVVGGLAPNAVLIPDRITALAVLIYDKVLDAADAQAITAVGANNVLRYLFKVDPVVGSYFLFSRIGTTMIKAGYQALLQAALNDDTLGAITSAAKDIIAQMGGNQDQRELNKAILVSFGDNNTVNLATAAQIPALLDAVRKYMDDAILQKALQGIDTTRANRRAATLTWLANNLGNKTYEKNHTVLEIARAAKVAGALAAGDALAGIDAAAIIAAPNAAEKLAALKLVVTDNASAGALPANVFESIIRGPIVSESVQALKYWLSYLSDADFQARRDYDFGGGGAHAADILNPGVDHGRGIIVLAARPAGDDPASLAAALSIFWTAAGGGDVATKPAAP